MDTPLKKARAEAQLSQAALADQIGVSQAAIASFESGEKRPSPETAEKLAAALGISELALLYPERFKG